MRGRLKGLHCESYGHDPQVAEIKTAMDRVWQIFRCDKCNAPMGRKEVTPKSK